MNIYMAGVGGQGIGLLSEVLLRALDKTGVAVRGVDTHGLAQRGGVVVSQIRTGEGEFSPLSAPGEVDLVLALERHEALRGMNGFLRRGGTLAWYDAVWQPFQVRNGALPEVSVSDVLRAAEERGVVPCRVYRDDLPDPRMQNTALIREVLNREMIPGLKLEHITDSLKELLPEKALEANLRILGE